MGHMEHTKRKCTQVVFIWLGVEWILFAQEIIENLTS